MLALPALWWVAPSAAAAPMPCSAQATNEAAALAQAARCATRVEIMSRRTETTEIFALPSGDFAAEISAVPVRVRQSNGAWRDVDMSLRRSAEGSLVPVASVVDVAFSGGGNTPLARLSVDGGQLSYTWPTPLPTPSIDGDSAVYPEVWPGIDLRVRPTVRGFGYALVVKSATAAANPQLRRIAVGVAGTNLTLRRSAEGAFEAVDSAGAAVIKVGGAAMWDAKGLAHRGQPLTSRSVDIGTLSAEAPDGSAVKDVPAVLSGDTLLVTPDLAMLTDPNTVFPVVIDPVATLSNFRWGYADSTNVDRDDGVARVGLNPDGSGTYRSFFYFASGTTIGGPATVTDAAFSITLRHSYSCGNTPVNAYSVGGFSAGRNTWPGPALGTWLGERGGHAHKGTGECPDDPQPNMSMIWDDSSLKGAVQYSLDQGWAAFAVGLSTRQKDGTSEATASWWKKFDPVSSRLHIEWNHAPTAPASVKVLAAGATDCSTASVTLTSATRPTFCATPQDSDGGTNRAEFEVWNSAHTTRELYSDGSVTNRTVASSAAWTATADLASTTHALRVQSCDAYGCGPWSAWLAFTVDYTPPSSPTVAAVSGGAATYPPKSSGVWAGGVGVSGNFSFTTSTDASGIEIELNGSSLGWMTPVRGAWIGTITPTKDGVNTLRARSRDDAGNTAGWGAAYEFLVRPAASKSWRWELDDSLSSADTVGSTVTYPGAYPVSGFTPAYSASAASKAVEFDGVGQALGTTGPVLDTSGSVTVTARVRLAVASSASAMTVASQDGVTGSGFRLQFRPDISIDGSSGAWCFAMFTSDGAVDTEATRACAPAWPSTTEFVNLAGVYDAIQHTLQMWIEDPDTGSMMMWIPATSGFTSSWSATGVFAIGRANGTDQFFAGVVDRVAVFNRPLNAAEINADKATA